MNSRLTPDGMRRVAEAFRERYRPGHVRGLLVAGSGLSLEVPGWEAAEEIDLSDVLPFPLHTLMGHRQTVTLWRRGDETLMVVNGRFHLYQGYRPEEVVAPVRLAGLLGVEVMIAINATGALVPGIEAGSLVIITDHLNLQGANPLVGEWGREFGPQFPDMSEVYDSELRRAAWPAAEEARIAHLFRTRTEATGIDLNDPGIVRKSKKANFRFYNAPHAIYLFQDASLTPWSLFDLGLFAQSLMLAAHARGLGTVPQAFATDYARQIKNFLSIPETKRLIIGLSVGYPDESSPVNTLRTDRVATEEILRWIE